MTNDELLEKIGNVIDTKLNARLEPISKRLDALEAGQNAMLDKMATKADVQELTEHISDFFNQTWEKMDETNERVTTIEDHLELPHPTKN